MTVADIIKAHKCCFRVDNLSCQDCSLCGVETKDRSCEKILLELTIEKLVAMKDLIDDRVNHHYYDTLEYYQEENARLRDKLEEIRLFVDKHTKEA